MLRLSFTHAAFLAGLASLAIPILIHLLLRRKKVRLRFSTLQFFLKKDEKTGRRRKLFHWLLLAARLCLLALLVSAFARPFLPESASAGHSHQKRQVVLVLDRSASMQATDTGVSRWSRAKDQLRKTVAEMGPDDEVALVDCAAPAAVLSPFVRAEQLESLIESLEPGFGEGDVGDGLQQAVKLLSARTPGSQPRIDILSDLQRQSCQKVIYAPVPEDIEVKIFPLGATNTPNLAVMDLVLQVTEKAPLQATVANYSDQNVGDGKLDWIIDGELHGSSPVVLSAHATTNVTAPLPSLTAGWHRIEAHLQAHDRFALDDARYQVIEVPPPLRTLCVETRAGQPVFKEESFFVASALQPGLGDSNAPPALFDLDKIAPEAIVKKLNGNPSEYRLVLLPAMRELPEGSGRTLFDFVRRGGGILFFMGGGLNASWYNAEFQELLPATVGRLEGQALTAENYWHLGEVDLKSAPFAVFSQPHSGDLTLAEFWRRYALAPAASAQVLARFDDGTPFLVCKNVGQGRVALANTTADTSWTDWPKHKTFVPWLHSVCHYLAGDTLSPGLRPGESFLASTVAELDLDPGLGNQSFRVRPPSGAELAVKTDARGGLQLPLGKPGFYAVEDSGGRVVRLLAVNPPRKESDLAAMNPQEFQQQLVRGPAQPEGRWVADVLAPGRREKELWRVLMLGAAVLLVLETTLSNRTFA
ncbi:MAG: BatA and WFA domain-containing protein [Verrucomicrobiia bacterium]